MEDKQFGVVCGVCGKEQVEFKACPIHHWAISSYCSSCGEFVKIADVCHALGCDFGKGK